MLKIDKATLLLSAIFSLSACKTRLADGSDLRSASAIACPTQKVDAQDLKNIIVIFPAECLAAQIKDTLIANIDALNATQPKYFTGLVNDNPNTAAPNIVLTNDKISLDGEVKIENNLAVFNIKDTVDYRLKRNFKEPSRSNVWTNFAYKVEILVKDWVPVQNVKFNFADPKFSGATNDDLQDINRMYMPTVQRSMQNPEQIAHQDRKKHTDAIAAKMTPGMAVSLLEAIKVDSSVKSLIPPGSASGNLNEAYIATGAIENNALVLKLTPRKAAAAPKP